MSSIFISDYEINHELTQFILQHLFKKYILVYFLCFVSYYLAGVELKPVTTESNILQPIDQMRLFSEIERGTIFSEYF